MASNFFTLNVVLLACLLCAESIKAASPQFTITVPPQGKLWALLVAGSSGYSNYRHQADLCHAYQILHNNGIPDENIIVMMADDIAYDRENPTPGVIINKPHGQDVYKGVLKDYTGSFVNSTNFLKVLTGDEEGMQGIGSGRVINSGPNDYIFVNFVDHGAPGLLAFPEDELYASDLESALQSMVTNRRFSKMVFYVEACESGSMFEKILPDNLNIFVTTAADPHESSYACYWDDLREAYLGDVYSVMWMEDSERENLLQETLHHQFQIVRARTNTSHVEEYGDLDLGAMHVSDFLGFHTTKINATKNLEELPNISDAVNNRHVPIAVIQKKLEKSKDAMQRRDLKMQLHKMLKLRQTLGSVIEQILTQAIGNDSEKFELLMNSKQKLTRENMHCYKDLASLFSNSCYKLSKHPYALTKLYVFLNACAEPWIDTTSIKKAISSVCTKIPNTQFQDTVL